MTYMNHLKNHWGLEVHVGIYDFTSKTGLDYEMFLSNHSHSEMPISFDMELEAIPSTNQQRRSCQQQ